MARARKLAPRSEAEDLPRGWQPRARNPAELDILVARLPTQPGVYVMRDRKGRVVYVGKARHLRSRVKQYFNGHDTRQFVPRLSRLVGDIETVVTQNDKEAMLLENELIKRHHPRFNVKLRDDKQYLVLRLDPRAEWPRLEVVRNIKRDGAQYFGPYHSASAARHTLRVVNRHFKLRTCTDFVLRSRKRPCLQFQIGRCPAPCVAEVDPDVYDEQVRDVGLFLTGRHGELVGGLRRRMLHKAQRLEYEAAALIRDQLRAVETTLQSQRIVSTADLDQDVVGMYRQGGQVEFAVLRVRRGKLMGSQTFTQTGMELPDKEVLGSFLVAYYDTNPFAPDELLLPFALASDDADPLAEWLGERRSRKVKIKVPVRGDRKRLIDLAQRNAQSSFVTRRDRKADGEAVLRRLQSRLGLSRPPRRIECYDVSHIQGSDPVASMVVFTDAEPDKARYRSFKIKGLEGSTHRQNDDFASMYEVLSRRFRRALEADDQKAAEDWALPDLLVIDGGKGQLGRVLAAMQDMGIARGVEGVDVVSLAKERRETLGHGRQALDKLKSRAKAQQGAASEPGAGLQQWAVEQPAVQPDPESVTVRPERVFVPDVREPIVLPRGSSELYVITRLRDEAHRFAIGHHRKRRGKRQLKSVLDDIPGVGPATKRALLAHFGKVAAIRDAKVDALAEVKGVGPALAQKIRTALGG